jgi:hypothetical protein
MLSYQYSQISRSIIAKYDEVASQFRSKVIEPLMEGVDNLGPQFPPTCLLQAERPKKCQHVAIWSENKPMDQSSQLYDEECYALNTTRNSMGAVGWCNRIFYKKMNKNDRDLNCIYYNSVDLLHYYRNSYRPVMGIFEI